MKPTYRLVAKGRILDSADRPHNLDYSKLHKAGEWSIEAVWPDNTRKVLAYVNWSPARAYAVYYEGTRVDTIKCYNKIIPIVRTALDAFYWENNTKGNIRITPTNVS